MIIGKEKFKHIVKVFKKEHKQPDFNIYRFHHRITQYFGCTSSDGIYLLNEIEKEASK